MRNGAAEVPDRPSAAHCRGCPLSPAEWRASAYPVHAPLQARRGSALLPVTRAPERRLGGRSADAGGVPEHAPQNVQAQPSGRVADVPLSDAARL